MTLDDRFRQLGVDLKTPPTADTSLADRLVWWTAYELYLTNILREGGYE